MTDTSREAVEISGKEKNPRAALRVLLEERDALKQSLEKAVFACEEQARARGEAEGKLAASEMAGLVDGWKARAEAAEAQRDALRANLDEAQAALRECMDEIDGYVRQEYPGDHPVHERYRKRDFSANPARVYLNARKDTP